MLEDVSIIEDVAILSETLFVIRDSCGALMGTANRLLCASELSLLGSGLVGTEEDIVVE